MLAGGSAEALGSDLPVVSVVCCPLADIWWQGDLHRYDIQRANNPAAVLQEPNMCQEAVPYNISEPNDFESAQGLICTFATQKLCRFC